MIFLKTLINRKGSSKVLLFISVGKVWRSDRKRFHANVYIFITIKIAG